MGAAAARRSQSRTLLMLYIQRLLRECLPRTANDEECCVIIARPFYLVANYGLFAHNGPDESTIHKG